MKATSTFQSGLHFVGCAIAVAVSLWARPAPAANILFIVNNPPGTASDVQVRDRLASQGHSVTVIDDNEPTMADLFADNLLPPTRHQPQDCSRLFQ